MSSNVKVAKIVVSGVICVAGFVALWSIDTQFIAIPVFFISLISLIAVHITSD